jgi:acyl carrier protein phosphodiesterase
MNYLAHVFLSGDHEKIRIGNFIADFIYGNHYKNYDPEIQKGILLHRYIDTYTDAHPIFRQSKRRLFSRFRHYSAVIVDMFYDHFLADNFSAYSEKDLEAFVSDFYKLMKENKKILPAKVNKIVPVMSQYNWLVNYRDIEYLGSILAQMNHKTKHNTELHKSIEVLENSYDLFKDDFVIFFEDMLMERKKMFKSLDIH